jgi:hypothetical protein
MHWLNRRAAALAAALIVTLASVVGVASTRPAQAADGTFSFELWGDVPYAKAGNAAEVPLMIADMNGEPLAFTIFDGDTKDGSSKCEDTVYSDAVARFNSVAAPTVYVLGDNEWTDCHRTNNGSWNALERLDHIRRTMFTTTRSFGRSTMELEHQGAPGQKYVENTRWTYQNVVFVGLNMPGSNNNYVRTADQCADSGKTKRSLQECMADNAEAYARDMANIDWMRRSFALAEKQNSPGIMFVIQADPGFDLPETSADERSDPALDGYTSFLDALVAETQAYSGQVVLVHGDSHFFKVDKPLAIDPAAKGNKLVINDNAHVIPNFTRVQTFGSANVQWVKATVNPGDRNVFTFEPMIVPAAKN